MFLDDQLRDLQRATRRFVDDELIPNESELVDGEALPAALHDRLRARLMELGVWALGVPKQYGGGGAGVLAQLVVTEELSRSLLGLQLAGRTGHPLPLLYEATPEQQQRYLLPVVRGERIGAFALTEPTGGSDPVGNMRTRARQVDAGWVIDGRKCFISLGDVADHIVVFAITDPDAGSRGVTAFLVDAQTPGFSVVRRIPTMGSTAPAELDFTDCLVPDDARVSEVGGGFALAQQLLAGARLEIGARAIGACDRLIDLALGYTRNRESFGIPLADHQGAQWTIADCAVDLDATRWMTYAAAARVDEGADTRLQVSMVKVFASEALGRVADRVMQLFGGWGYAKGLPVERFYREARMWRIVDGPNEIHRVVIARQLARSGIAALRPA
ncbi:MAG TPA: acyl-CoA dehydrogenase family protein [Mycobacteriales bacterium]|nr:acyl-CoA dehydrogenase family protein [Mycobacteriales bacterium]